MIGGQSNMGIGALIALSAFGVGTSVVQARKSAKQQKKVAEESQARISQQQTEVKQQQAEETAAAAATEEQAAKKKGSRLALISTSPQGILGSDPGVNIGRRKLLGN